MTLINIGMPMTKPDSPLFGQGNAVFHNRLFKTMTSPQKWKLS
ncbi:hypothetical protein M2403_000017 [Rahnella sp. BIGb0603]|jgi:hypothetical protein|nr:hypothetical protein [Rahnella sp. BIGb0603]